MKDLLANLAAIIAALTIGTLLLAIGYEWGYFWLIGRDFQALLTTSDYLSNTIFWLPFGLFFTQGGIEWWRLDPEEPPKKNWKRWQTWVWPCICFLVVVFVLSIATWPPSSAAVYAFLGVSVFLWSKMWRSVPIEVLPEPYKTAAREVVRLLPPAMIAMFGLGWVMADMHLTRKDVQAFRFKGASADELRVNFRTLEKGVLVRNLLTDRMEFYRWENIESISKGVPGKAESIMCHMFEWCPTRKVSSPL